MNINLIRNSWEQDLLEMGKNYKDVRLWTAVFIKFFHVPISHWEFDHATIWEQEQDKNETGKQIGSWKKLIWRQEQTWMEIEIYKKEEKQKWRKENQK